MQSNAIQRMEVLRDGAASQYGSDAIAGVVNIRLKNEPLDPTVETRLGGYVTDPYSNDGTTYSVRPSFGVPLGDEGGFLNFFGEFRLRTPTNRAGPDGSPESHGLNAGCASSAGGRPAFLRTRRPGRRGLRVGNSFRCARGRAERWDPRPHSPFPPVGPGSTDD